MCTYCISSCFVLLCQDMYCSLSATHPRESYVHACWPPTPPTVALTRSRFRPRVVSLVVRRIVYGPFFAAMANVLAFVPMAFQPP
ncbi:hypothetical protein C8Q77DRAFT_1100874 [Trametes polyzona]|nr:hypothetical protein C8Q77DRAFT_1100874 [Trametes polyzona]